MDGGRDGGHLERPKHGPAQFVLSDMKELLLGKGGGSRGRLVFSLSEIIIIIIIRFMFTAVKPVRPVRASPTQQPVSPPQMRRARILPACPSLCGLWSPLPSPPRRRLSSHEAAGLTGPLLFREMFFHRRSCSWCRKPILSRLSSAVLGCPHASIPAGASGGNIPSEPVTVRTLVSAGLTLLSSVVS